MSEPIYVVVCQNDKETSPGCAVDPDGPLAMETYLKHATLEQARERAAKYEARWGACRIARLVFEDEQGKPL